MLRRSLRLAAARTKRTTTIMHFSHNDNYAI